MAKFRYKKTDEGWKVGTNKLHSYVRLCATESSAEYWSEHYNTHGITFDEWLELQLARESPDWFDPAGNSSTAVLMRGRLKEAIQAYREYPAHYVSVLKHWDGWGTELGWFAAVVIMTVAFPIVPAIGGLLSYRRAMREYRQEYEREVSA